MKGDFTRFTHDPKKHYSRVLKQQGRVDLDADWNENEEIQQHLAETTNKDVIGICGVPKRAKSSFSLEWKDRDLKVSPGRIYVDGILCELEKDVSYSCQPDYPNPQELVPGDGRTDLVYLDVWHRHITAIEDPDIREVALGGPDTTTRLKTVAQVKVLKDVGAINCEHQIKAGWPPVPILTNRGKLSTQAEPGMTDEPCVIAPGGGYRGLENRLYRVEIHSGGKIVHNPNSRISSPTFKWSRDNGSVVMRIEKFNGIKVFVKSKGKDQVLALRKNDWVEVLGDETELSGEPGTLALIVDGPNLEQVIDGKEQMFAITLSEDFSKHINEGNPRVRRWDHGEKNSNELADGAIPVRINQWIELEDGIQIRFQPGTYYTGDFWVFAARTAAGKVETLDRAPPRGIEHHYCKLALVTWKEENNQIAADILPCIKVFPPLTELPKVGANCCTVTVGDGVTSVGDYSDIQEAIDSLPSEGGRVCILPGTYNLQLPVEIKRDNLIVRGCGRQTQILAKDFPAFVAEGNNLQLDSLKVEASSTQVAVLVSNSENLQIVECDLKNENNYVLGVVAGKEVNIKENMLNSPNGLFLQAENGHILGNSLSSGGMWILQGSEEICIEGNRTSGGCGPGIILGGLPSNNERDVFLESFSQGVKIKKTICVSAVEILGNQIYGMDNSGISTHKDISILKDVTIAHNRILGCARKGPDPKFEEQAVGGIVLREVDGLRIIDNYIAGNGEGGVAACGIFVDGCQGLQVTGNTVIGNGSHQLQCVHFTITESKNVTPLDIDGVKFTAENIAICHDPITDLDGFLCGEQTEIELPQPVQMVRLTFASIGGKESADTTELSSLLCIELFSNGEKPVATSQVTYDYQTIELQNADIKKIRITDKNHNKKTLLLELCFGETITSYQAGIVALNVDNQNSTEKQLGGYAASIHNNSVVCPRGQALILFGWGPMSITGNTLTSLGRAEMPTSITGNTYPVTSKMPISNDAAILRAILGVSQVVFIFNMGHTLGLTEAFIEESDMNWNAQGVLNNNPDNSMVNGVIRRILENLPFINGQVIFHDNQITLENMMAPRFIIPKYPFISDMSSLLISLDDLSIQNNQFLADAMGLLTNALALSMTLRLSGNRFVERLLRAFASCFSLAAGNITTDNQAIHCIYPLGIKKSLNDNQMLYCPSAKMNNSMRNKTLSSEKLISEFDQLLSQVADASVPLLQKIEDYYVKRAERLSNFENCLEKDLGEDHPHVIALAKAAEKAEGLRIPINTAINRESLRPKIGPQEWMAFGTVLDSKGKPLPGLRVRVYDKEQKYDDLLSETTDEYGDFYLKYHEINIREAYEKTPELYIMVEDQSGRQLYSSKNPVRRNPGQASYFKISLKEGELEEETNHKRC